MKSDVRSCQNQKCLVNFKCPLPDSINHQMTGRVQLLQSFHEPSLFHKEPMQRIARRGRAEASLTGLGKGLSRIVRTNSGLYTLEKEKFEQKMNEKQKTKQPLEMNKCWRLRFFIFAVCCRCLHRGPHLRLQGRRLTLQLLRAALAQDISKVWLVFFGFGGSNRSLFPKGLGFQVDEF